MIADGYSGMGNIEEKIVVSSPKPQTAVKKDQLLFALTLSMRAGGPHSQHLDFLNRFSDPDHSFTQNLRAQATAMHQAGQNLFVRESLQMRAWLAQLQAAGLYLANPELFADQVIQRHAARDYVAAAVTESVANIQLALQRLDCLGFDQSQFATCLRLPESSLLSEIAITLQAMARDGAHFAD